MGVQTLVIATHNQDKAREMIAILHELMPELKLKTFADYEGVAEPEETGSTYQENAQIKALNAARSTGEWSIADDAGLEVDALDGAPGLYSRRFQGEHTPFQNKIEKIIELVQDVPADKRTARFRCAVALCSPDGKTTMFEATCEGRIGTEARGTNGFGYDPIFLLEDSDLTMAQLTPEQKHTISHRGKALRMLAEHLCKAPITTE